MNQPNADIGNEPECWTCVIGEVDRALLPDGSDLPMRKAVQQAYLELTGQQANFCFSGWGYTLDETQRATERG